MRFFILPFIAFSAVTSAKVLVSYNASAGDATSVLGTLNLAGYDDAVWPSGSAENSSAYFTTSTDPDGNKAAHVHKDAHFARSEYHILKDKTEADSTYYIGYKVRWDAVDYQLIVFQWKDYSSYTSEDDIPACLVFRKDPDDAQNHTITFAAAPDPTNSSSSGTVWSKTLTMGETYHFGIVVNTAPSTTNGFVQLYFEGKLATMIDGSTGEHTQKLAGNFFPGGSTGAASPKVGLYGNKNPIADDSYIYNVVVGTDLDDIREVANIAKNYI